MDTKKIIDHQDESKLSSPPEKKLFQYHQDRINVSSIYLATKLADVHFAFDSDDGTVSRIPAHKALLAVTSDVFEKMFCGELKESGDIKIVDASEAAFKEFLEFFYLNDVKLSAEHVASVLYLGNKYNVENCVDACGKCIADDLSNENVCAALSLAIFYHQKELSEACERHIMLNTAETFQSAEFMDSSKEVLGHILQMNLFSCFEVDVFDACMEWVRAKSKQQELSRAMVEEHLGDLVYQIRFASMTTKEICNLKTKYSAVLSSDLEAIIRLIERVDIDSERFSTSTRQVKWNEDEDAILKCNRDRTIMLWYALDDEEKLIFSISVPLLLGEFECNPILFGKDNPQVIESDLSVEVRIIEARKLDDANNVKVLCSMTANLNSDINTVSLPHPILIRPDFFYTICISGFPQGHSFPSFDQEKSDILETDIKIEFHNDKLDEEDIIGLIFALKFNKI